MPFYSNSSLQSSDVKTLSEKIAFNEMLTVGVLPHHLDIYSVHRCVVLLYDFYGNLVLYKPVVL